MANGVAAAGLGAGFAKSLAGALSQSRQTQREESQLAEERKWREFQTLWPVRFQMFQENPTPEAAAELEDWTTQYVPGLKKAIKRTGMSFESLGPLLAGQAQAPAGQVTEMIPGAPGIPGTAPATPPVEARTQIAMPGPTTLFGAPVLTPEQRAERETGLEISKLERTRTAQMHLARRMLPQLQQIDPSITLEDALRYVSKGELVTPASAYRTGQFYRYGVDREAISKALFEKPYDQLTRQEADIVLREEKSMLELEAQARGTGTATARFQAPLTAGEAQAAGVPTGTRSSELAGQVVPTLQQQDRRRSVQELQENLTYIRDNLLVALPKKGELGGMAPGAAYALRRRSNQYREQIASLESAINNVVNVMARSVGEQRGTQTERDALRAEAAIAQIRDAILTGDTQESATARIDQSLRVLEGILGRLPVQPTPQQTPRAGRPGGQGQTAAPTAVQDAQGNWTIP